MPPSSVSPMMNQQQHHQQMMMQQRMQHMGNNMGPMGPMRGPNQMDMNNGMMGHHMRPMNPAMMMQMQNQPHPQQQNQQPHPMNMPGNRPPPPEYGKNMPQMVILKCFFFYLVNI